MRIIYIHGIGQQKPSADLKRDWDVALLGHDAGEGSQFAYWADILHALRKARAGEVEFAFAETAKGSDALKAAVEDLAPDNDEARAFARKLFDRMENAPTPEEDIEPVADEDSDGLCTVKALPGEGIRRVVTWAITRAFIHDVAAYFYEPGVRGEIDRRLEAVLVPGAEPYTLVSHSLGTVVSYEVLHRLETSVVVPLWVTLGSPLGIAEVQGQIRKPLDVPPSVDRWVNLADRFDPVALDARLANEYEPGAKITDFRVKNPCRYAPRAGGPHAALGYLAELADRDVLR